MKKCKDCCYYDNRVCRINPPTVGFYTSKFAQQQRINVESAWPSVNPEKDWCSQFSESGNMLKAAMEARD